MNTIVLVPRQMELTQSANKSVNTNLVSIRSDKVKKFMAGVALSFAAIAANAADYKFDTAHTQIFFSINHLGFSNSTGQFTDFDGGFTFDEKDFSKSSVNVTINTDSIDIANHKKWIEHMTSKDFFHSEKFPTMEFKSTKVKKTGDKTMDVAGDLTIKGVTKPVVLNVIFNKAGESFGTEKAGFSATTTIDRTEFGLDTYAPNVGTEVPIRIEVEGEKI